MVISHTTLSLQHNKIGLDWNFELLPMIAEIALTGMNQQCMMTLIILSQVTEESIRRTSGNNNLLHFSILIRMQREK